MLYSTPRRPEPQAVFFPIPRRLFSPQTPRSEVMSGAVIYTKALPLGVIIRLPSYVFTPKTDI